MDLLNADNIDPALQEVVVTLGIVRENLIMTIDIDLLIDLRGPSAAAKLVTTEKTKLAGNPGE